MIINKQKAQIRPEKSGCTVRYLGSTYPPKKVFLQGTTIKEMLSKFPPEEYQDVIMNGTLDNQHNEITITSIERI